MQLEEIQRKSRILKRAEFGCLRDSFSVNITRGCSFKCVYCYARGYAQAPQEGRIYLYADLPAKLARELDSPRRRLKVQRISFNTSTDCFQEHPRIQEVAYQTMEACLRRGITISFLTKGTIPGSFLELFSRYPGLVRAAVGLVSTSESYRKVFEPGTASIRDRLENIARLRSCGIRVQVRVDPVLPFLTDDHGSIESLMQALSRNGAKEISLSYLHLRPRILEQLQKELPPFQFQVLHSCFQGKEWTRVGTSTRSKLVPASLRQKGYTRFLGSAKSYGIRAVICACKNPDLSGEICSFNPGPSRSDARPGYQERQLSFFDL